MVDKTRGTVGALSWSLPSDLYHKFLLLLKGVPTPKTVVKSWRVGNLELGEEGKGGIFGYSLRIAPNHRAGANMYIKKDESDEMQYYPNIKPNSDSIATYYLQQGSNHNCETETLEALLTSVWYYEFI